MTKVGAIILARMGSSRLPGKALVPLCGIPVLEHVVRRLERVEGLTEVVVATTMAPEDDVLEHFCQGWNTSCFRGSVSNVLERCLGAEEAHGLDVVIRLGGDSPLADSMVIGRMLSRFKENQPDYLSNTLARSFPLGLDAEIFAAGVFRRISEIVRELPEPERRSNEENVVPYLHQHPEIFKLHSFEEPPIFPEARLTLDSPADFVLIEKIYEALFPGQPAFGLSEIEGLLKTNPEWLKINSGVVPVSGFWTTSEKQRFEKQYGRHHG
ncbi:MAG: glycosyltransferase family protein [Proteobacteria bacterium]|nr:glycosyltransferase family protein [Pseudomonadota bacterium]